MTKGEIKRLVTFAALLVVGFVVMLLIGANIPYTPVVAPDPIPSSQKFIEFCIDAIQWIKDYAILLAVLIASLFLVVKVPPKRRR